MNFFRTLWRKGLSIGHRKTVNREIDDELRFHMEMRTAENIAAGMSPEEAVRAARRRFGNQQTVREECREVRGASFGETTLRDIRFTEIRMKPPDSIRFRIGAATWRIALAMPFPNILYKFRHVRCLYE